MPEPSDPLSERLAAAPGLPTLLAEARATWLARTERDAAAVAEAPVVEGDEDAAAGGPPAVRDSQPSGPSAARRPERDAATGGPSVHVRPSTPRWRAFEDAFPTFYQFTNRPRG